MGFFSRPLAWLGALLFIGVTVAGQSPTVDLERKGPKVGERVPDFSGVDQFGATQTLKSALKADGAMLVFFRSADW